MSAKKRHMKVKIDTEQAAHILNNLGNSIAAIRNIGKEFSYGDGPVTAATVTTCVDVMTAKMLNEVDAALEALDFGVLGGFADGEGVSHA